MRPQNPLAIQSDWAYFVAPMGLTLGQWTKGILAAALLAASWSIGLRFLIDFEVFYAAAQAGAQGNLERIYSVNLGTSTGARFFYAPLAVSLLKPLGHLGLEQARYLWLGLQTIAFFVFWLSMGALYPWLREKKLSVGWVLFFLACIPPIHLNFQSNNIGLMLVAVLCLAEVLARSRSNSLGVLAGMLAAFAAVIKVFPLFIVAYYLVARRRSVAVGIVSGFALAVLVPVVTFGPSASVQLHVEFFHAVASYAKDNAILAHADILCLPALIQRGFQGVFLPRTLEVISTLSGVVIAGLFLFFSRRPKASSQVQVIPTVSLHNWALALLIMTLINPSTRPHYFVFYLPAVASLISWTREGRTSSIVAFGALTLGLGMWIGTTQGVLGRELNDWLEWRNIPTLGILVIGISLVVKLFLERNFSQVRTLDYR